MMQITTLKHYYPQWLTGIGATVIFIEVGIMCGWSSPYLARLTQPESPMPLTPEQASWVASLLNLGRFLGAICGSVSVNYLGSKRTLTMTVIPIGLCWLFTMAASSFIWLYAARASGGFGLGMAYSCFALYIGEVALPEIRGALLSLAISGGGCFGVLASSILGPYLSMRVSGGIFLVPCILVFLLLLWLPDSPHWLVKTEDYDGAKRSIAWYQPQNDPNKELAIIKNLVETSSESFRGKLKKLRSRPMVKAILLIIVLFTFMQLTGLNSITFYMETILIRSKLSIIDPSTVVICVNATSILTTVLSMFLIDTYGRKFLLIVSCAGVATSMAGMGANAYLITLGANEMDWQWLPIVSIFLFAIFFFIGLISVPSTVLSEIFPSDVKCIAACISSLIGALWSFVATKSFQPLIDTIGEAYVFWLHGAFAVILIPYVILCMPETKGKSLQEIQDQLMKT